MFEISLTATQETADEVQYRGDCDGSDKRYAFSMDGKRSSGKLYVFEAPIDLLSHATIGDKAKSVIFLCQIF